MRHKTFIIVVLGFVMSLFFFCLAYADNRLEGGGGSIQARYRTYYYYSGNKTYVGYYDSGTFACGGTFNYGVEVWQSGSGAHMIFSDLCSPASSKSIFTCSGHPCAYVRLSNVNESYYGCFGFCSSSNSYKVFEVSDGYRALEWATGIVDDEVVWGDEQPDYDCDGLPNIEDCLVCSQESCFSPTWGTGIQYGMEQTPGARKYLGSRKKGVGGYEKPAN